MPRGKRVTAGLDSANWALLLKQAGFTGVEGGGSLGHPAGAPALRLHRGRDGRVWFSGLRAEAARFDPALWRQITSPRKSDRRPERIALIPRAGCEAAALRWLVSAQTDDDAALVLSRRSDLDQEQRGALLAARTGQGAFRHAVEQHEHACRVTGLLDRRHLRAVHIKSWRVCDDVEKLDGHNGLLLSPHVAHLFETGGLTFVDGGDLKWSSHLNPAVVKSWRLPSALKAAEFSAPQRRYLDWHRQHLFETERRPWPRRSGS